jgi:hypothetical protein
VLSDSHKWFTSWLPLAREATPFMTVLLAVILVVSVWWFVHKLEDCVERNRVMTDRLLVQQETFHRELMACLAHCPPQRP